MRRAKPGGRRPTGALDLTAMFWLVLVALAIYFGIMYLPPQIEAYEVKHMLRVVAAEAVRQPDDGAIRREILSRARAIGSHYEIRDGQERILPGVVLLDEDIVVNRDVQAKTIVLQVRYTKYVNYPFTQKQAEMTFTPAVKADISEVKW